MVHYGVDDAAQRLGITDGPRIEAFSWFIPREGTWENGRLRPFPLAVSPDHSRNVDALLALHAQWPLTMHAFLTVGDFGAGGIPDGAMTRMGLLTCRSELIADALACFRSELAMLDMLLVALLSDHHMGGEIGSLFLRWCFTRDRVIAEIMLARGIGMRAGTVQVGGHLVPCICAAMLALMLSMHYFVDYPFPPPIILASGSAAPVGA